VDGTCPLCAFTSSGYVTGAITRSCTVRLAAVVPVDLSNFFTSDGIINPGLTNPTSGIDGSGLGLSARQLLNPSAWPSGTVGLAEAVPFNVAFPGNPLHDVPNAFIANGQGIPMPAGQYHAIAILAVDAGISSAGQPDLVFFVSYDYDAGRVVQSVSDVLTVHNDYLGQFVAATTQTLVNKDGSAGNGPAFLYVYGLPIDGTKTLRSIQLPNSGKSNGMSIFAISLLPGQ